MLLAALTGLSAPAFAQDPGEVPFAMHSWETDDGMPHNGVNAIHQRPDGFLWVATQDGVVRFYGIDFVHRRSPLLTQARSSRMVETAIAQDKLAVTGNLDLGGALLTVTDLGATNLPVGSKFVVASYTGGLSGAFSNAPDGCTPAAGTNTYLVDHDENVLGVTSITLTVPNDSAYDEWAELNGLDGTNDGKLDDPDKDGRANVIEFGLDGNPLSGANDGKSVSCIADVDPGAGVENAFTPTLPVRTGAVFNGPGDLESDEIDEIIYKIQGSTGLIDFTTLAVTLVTPALTDDMPGLSTG